MTVRECGTCARWLPPADGEALMEDETPERRRRECAATGLYLWHDSRCDLWEARA